MNVSSTRTVLVIELEPIVGQRFQPTGFPDIGAAEFELGQGKCALLVESAQSMANRLEATTWDEAKAAPVQECAALPYLDIRDPKGRFLSSSRQEAHRLASAYVMHGTVSGTKGEDWLRERLGLQKGRPIDYRAVAEACFQLDPLSLIHGVFFARRNWPWQPKIARAVTSFIEAYGVRPVVSGGVKRERVYNEVEANRDTVEGYGTVPHHRVEYTADSIKAYFCIDHAQLRSYGLSDPRTAMLEAIIDFEIARLIEGGLRLRTACDLKVASIETGELPVASEAAKRIERLAHECALGPVTTVTWTGKS